MSLFSRITAKTFRKKADEFNKKISKISGLLECIINASNNGEYKLKIKEKISEYDIMQLRDLGFEVIEDFNGAGSYTIKWYKKRFD